MWRLPMHLARAGLLAKVGTVALCLLALVDSGYAQDDKLAGTWRIIDEPGRQSNCDAEYDTINVGESRVSVSKFIETHYGPRDLTPEKEEIRQRILRATQSKEESVRFFTLSFYDGCNFHSTEFVASANGTTEEVAGYHRVTAVACSHQILDGATALGPRAEQKSRKEQDHVFEARQACDRKNALEMRGLTRMVLKDDNLVVTHRDNSTQKFQRLR